MGEGVSFDKVYETFLNITDVELYNLPQTDEGKYGLISSARVLYNIENDFVLEQDNDTETLFGDLLTEKNQLLLANYIKLQVLINMRESFISEYGMHTKEVGVVHYDSQKKGRELAVLEQENRISKLRQKLFLEYVEV